ncbi:MAG: class I SAM-dependent methyltransferase [Parachlamydiaceae bacterium]|nr:class I SAM-dependent methyltransferase [Parachlamydiaceae bacterium]
MLNSVLFICILFFSFSSTCLNANPSTEETPWSDYYQNTRHFTRQEKTLSLALTFFKDENKTVGRAADLGAGTGRDTLFLLNKGWHVLALDETTMAIDIIRKRTPSNLLKNLTTTTQPFSEMSLPKNLDLINASNSLPFCHPNDFPACWNGIVNSLAPSGRFCGQFFGTEDDWADNPNLTCLSLNDVLNLFQDDFEIEYFDEEKEFDLRNDGSLKHWHIYHIVARLRGSAP